MDISQLDIYTLLPQQPPFVMVDRLVYNDKVFTKTELLVREDNLFYQEGKLTESGVIENMAQTCAARMGYIRSILNKGDIKMGFIGSISDLHLYQLPKLGDLLETRIEIRSEIFNITLVQAKVCVGKILIAECNMKIAE
jgi:predicted hotdog family 3-hydroxylacyl-ACP dehydratase